MSDLARAAISYRFRRTSDAERCCFYTTMKDVQFVDTTLRDGQLSLWALGMKTGAMLAIAEQVDRCGFQSLEFFGFAGFIKYVREHKENPFDWIRLGAKKFHRTRLRYHGGLASGFEKVPRSVRKLMIERIVAHGITLTRSSDPWNDYEAAVVENQALRELGMDVVVNIIYSVSPRHNDEYYAEKARQAAAIKPYRICFKDVAGLLTPERTRALVRLIKQISATSRSNFTPTATTVWHRSTISKHSSSASLFFIRRFRRSPTAHRSLRYSISPLTHPRAATKCRSI